MNKELIKLYKHILVYKFKICDVSQHGDSMVIELDLWLHPTYEPNRVLEVTVILKPRE